MYTSQPLLGAIIIMHTKFCSIVKTYTKCRSKGGGGGGVLCAMAQSDHNSHIIIHCTCTSNLASDWVREPGMSVSLDWRNSS